MTALRKSSSVNGHGEPLAGSACGDSLALVGTRAGEGSVCDETEPAPESAASSAICDYCGGKGTVVVPHTIWRNEHLEECPDCDGLGICEVFV